MNVQKQKQNGLPVLWRRWGWWQRGALRLLTAFPPAFLWFCAYCSFSPFVFPCFLSPCDEALRTVLASPFKLGSGFCVMFVLMFVYSSFTLPSLSLWFFLLAPLFFLFSSFCSPCLFSLRPPSVLPFLFPSPVRIPSLAFIVGEWHPSHLVMKTQDRFCRSSDGRGVRFSGLVSGRRRTILFETTPFDC